MWEDLLIKLHTIGNWKRTLNFSESGCLKWKQYLKKQVRDLESKKSLAGRMKKIKDT
jgi:hypothetical protein